MKTFLLLLSVCALGHSFIDLPNLFNILHSRENLNAKKNKETLAKEINGYGTQEVELGKRVKRQEKTEATTASTATTKAGDTTATTKAGDTTATTKAGETTATTKAGETTATTKAGETTATTKAGETTATTKAGETTATTKAGETTATTKAGETTATTKAGETTATTKAGETTATTKAGETTATTKAGETTATTKAGETTATTKAGETTATTKAGETTAPPKGGAKPTEAPKSAGPPAPPAPAGVDPQVFSQYPLWRMYNNKNAKHRYVANAWGAGQLMEQGYHFEGASGSLIDYDMYNRHSDVLLRECPDLVLLRVFYSPVGTQFVTVDKNAAQWRLNHGWREQRPAGYCSFLQTCGANQSLRLVSALDGSDMVITTNSYELGTLNQQPRFKGTLSPTICWMW